MPNNKRYRFIVEARNKAGKVMFVLETSSYEDAIATFRRWCAEPECNLVSITSA